MKATSKTKESGISWANNPQFEECSIVPLDINGSLAGISDFGEDVVSEARSASGGISGGGVLRGKKDRDDRRKSYKTTLKNTKP